MSSGYKFKHGGKRVHRLVWVEHNGAIPEGMVIHHKDGDKSNNDISNLEMMKRGDHVKLHQPESKAARIAGLARSYDARMRWHRSEDGRAWHRANFETSKEALLAKKFDCVCQNCHKEFKSRVEAKFCSDKCVTAKRKASGIDDVVRNCDHCGAEFKVNKYTKTRFCARLCSRLYWAQRS